AHSNHSVFSKQAYLFNQIMFNAASVVLDKDEQLDTDKLEAQFSATHFVPLTTGVVLQSGRYKITTQIASGGM
ncbi:hypothetical protein ACPXBB_26560, partial [Escherichia coli]|uniref:hypothetical protein n=1 Tax=Escherichia coli TaxID=562 RepID=UPI003CF8AF48